MPTAYTRITKTCTLCKNRKPVAEFGTNNRNKDGKHSWCKQCTRDYMAGRIPKVRMVTPATPTQEAHAQPTPTEGDQWWLTDPLISQIIPKSMRPKDGTAPHAASAPAPAALMEHSSVPAPPKHKPVVVTWNANRPPLWVDAPDSEWFTPAPTR